MDGSRSSTTTPKRLSGPIWSRIWNPVLEVCWRSTARARARRTFPRKVVRNCGVPLNLSRGSMPLRCSATLHYRILIDLLMLLFWHRQQSYSQTQRHLPKGGACSASLVAEPLLLFLPQDSAQPPMPRSRRRPGRIIMMRSGCGSSGVISTLSSRSPAAAVIADGEQIATTMWGAGWRALRGYDYLDAAEDAGKDIATKVGDMAKKATSSETPLFVVQADRAYDVSSSSAALGWTRRAWEDDGATRLMARTRRPTTFPNFVVPIASTPSS